MEQNIQQKYLNDIEDAPDILLYKGLYGLLDHFVFWLRLNGHMPKESATTQNMDDCDHGEVVDGVCQWCGLKLDLEPTTQNGEGAP